MAAFPTITPMVLLREGFQLRPTPKTTTAFSTEVGGGKSRRRSTKRTKPISGRVEMLRAGWEQFVEWYEDEIADGTMPFAWQTPLDNEPVLYKFDPEDPYIIEPVGGLWWVVSVNVIRQS